MAWAGRPPERCGSEPGAVLCAEGGAAGLAGAAGALAVNADVLGAAGGAVLLAELLAAKGYFD